MWEFNRVECSDGAICRRRICNSTLVSLAMTDVRFDRSDQAESGLLSILLKGFAQGRDFDRVAELGARAMGFDVADMPRVGTGFRQRPTDRGGLRLRVRDRVAVGLAAMVEGAASNDAVNVVAVSLRIGEPFQDDYSNPFPRNIPVAALAEALAVAVAGDELPGAERQVLIGMNADVDPSGDGQAGSPQCQILAGEVDGGQRRRTHGIERHAGTMQVQRVRHAIGDTGDAGSNSQAFALHTGFGAKQLILAIHYADVHADLTGKIALSRQVLLRGCLQARARVSRVFDRHPHMM